MDYGFLDPWHDFLPRESGHVLGLVGDGDLAVVGTAIADFYRDLGQGVALCTAPAVESWPDFVSGNRPSGPRWQVGMPSDGAADRVDELRERYPDRVILYLPAAGWAAWPRATSLALIVMDGQSVGLRADRVVPDGSFGPGELYGWPHLEGRLGDILERIPPDVPVVAAVSALEEVADSIGLFALADRLMQHPRLPLIAFARRGGDGPVVRVAYREGNGKDT